MPIDGEVREGVGLLGSPSFEIPRSVARDSDLDVRDPAELRRRLGAKNRHNAVTIALRLLSRWIHLFGLTLLSLGSVNLYQVWGAPAVLPLTIAGLLFTVAFFVAVERAVDRLQTVAPAGCSIYVRTFWRHERAWKVPSESYYKAFDGTPFKNVLWRLLGVRIGRRVFDDGCFLTERTFTAIGDDCTLNAGSVIQCHSQEDGAFKSDHTVLGAGCTLGVGSFVHYGVTMGAGAALAPDSFLMKGEEIAPRGRWGGNPAIEFFDTVDDLRDVLVDRTRPPGRPSRRTSTLATPPGSRRRRSLPAALAATALSALIVLALSGGTAVAMGVPVPFRPAAAASAVPGVTRPTTPPPSSAPTSGPAAELTTTPGPAESTAPAKRPGSTSAKASTSAKTKQRATTTSRRATTTPQRTTTTTPRATTTSTSPATTSSASTGARGDHTPPTTCSSR